MRNKLKLFGMAALTCIASTTLAGLTPKPHTWHTIRSGEGVWNARLQFINQSGSFVSRDEKPLTSFTISPAHPQDYGFIFDEGADFDIAYTLTLTQQSNTSFTSKACVYVITASGPARPDVRVSSFHGAKCDWTVVKGVGEDFLVS